MKYIAIIGLTIFGMLMGMLATVMFTTGVEAIRPHINLLFVAQLAAGSSFVMVVSGVWLFTFHTDGRCCNKGCRHEIQPTQH